MAHKLDKSVITIQRGLKQLVELGIAERIGSNKTGFWRLKNNSFIRNNKDKTLLVVASWIQDAFYPIPSSLIDFDFNDDNILAINIKEGTNKPYYLKEKGPKPSVILIILFVQI